MDLFFDNDAGSDDLISLALLLADTRVALKGVAVTPADCILESGLEANRRIISYSGRSVPLAAGVLEGKNPFPDSWRQDSDRALTVPSLQRRCSSTVSVSTAPAHELLATTLRQASSPLTVLCTGPLTNLAAVLSEEPALAKKVLALHWMGGALDVAGNVVVPNRPVVAEWNVYWDPPAADFIWKSDIPIVLTPLDATCKVPITDYFFSLLQKAPPHSAARLTHELLSTAATGPQYFLWDTLATIFLLTPELTTYQEVRCRVVPDGDEEGRIVRDEGGRRVSIPALFNTEKVYDCVAKLLGTLIFR